jgi:hypothetical protein
MKKMSLHSRSALPSDLNSMARLGWCRWLLALPLALGALTRPCPAGDVVIRVDIAKTHQVLEGFGATTLSLIHEGAAGDPLSPALRSNVLEAVYGQVKLTMGNLAAGLLESSDALVQVTAFRDNLEQRLVLVVINNAAEARMLLITAAQLGARGKVTGEQSFGHTRWQALQSFAPETRDRLKTTIPALSVTSLAVSRD